MRSLLRTYYTRIELELAYKVLRDIDQVIRGADPIMEGENERGNGFWGWVERGTDVLEDREGKLGMVEGLVERVVDCDVAICDFLLEGFGVERGVMKVILDCVSGLTGNAWRGEDEVEGEDEEDGEDGREGGHQIRFEVHGENGHQIRFEVGGGGGGRLIVFEDGDVDVEDEEEEQDGREDGRQIRFEGGGGSGRRSVFGGGDVDGG